MRVLFNIRTICLEGITEFKVYKPSEILKMDSKELGKLDYIIRKDSGFSYIWLKGSLCFVEVCKPSKIGVLSSIIERKKEDFLQDKITLNNQMWEHDVPRLIYSAIREAACKTSPGKILPRGTRKLMYPDVLFPNDIDEMLNGLSIAIHRVDESGVALSADYIRDHKDFNLKLPVLKHPNPDDRWERVEILLDQLIPENGLPFHVGGNNLTISSKSLSMKLEEESD